MIYQIIYSSDASTPMQAEDLEEILEDARSRNTKNGITGALVYVDGVFLQILEGNKSDVQDLLGKISGDVRNENLIVLQESELPSATFGDWKMAYVSATSDQVADWAGLNGAADITEVLTDLRQDHQKVGQVTQSILAALVQDTEEPPKSE